jgi:hypothetical protein
MKHKEIILIIGMLIVSGLTELHAQSKLVVKNKSGTPITYVLNQVKKLSFSTDKIIFNLKDGNISTYELSDVCNLSFNNLVDKIEPVDNLKCSNFTLYPNPAFDDIQISYELAKPADILLEISDLLGKVLYHQILSSHIGTNHVTISLERFPTGFYLFRIQKGTPPEIIKFLKY